MGKVFFGKKNTNLCITQCCKIWTFLLLSWGYRRTIKDKPFFTKTCVATCLVNSFIWTFSHFYGTDYWCYVLLNTRVNLQLHSTALARQASYGLVFEFGSDYTYKYFYILLDNNNNLYTPSTKNSLHGITTNYLKRWARQVVFWKPLNVKYSEIVLICCMDMYVFLLPGILLTTSHIWSCIEFFLDTIWHGQMGPTAKCVGKKIFLCVAVAVHTFEDLKVHMAGSTNFSP